MKLFDGYRIRLVLIGFVTAIVIGGTGRTNADFTYGTPTNLGPTVNSSSDDHEANTSPDGLALFFSSFRSVGYGERDLWVSTRATTNGDWGTPMNLGSTINSSYRDSGPRISADGLSLFFDSSRPGGYGDRDIWVTTRETTNYPWGEPVNVGPTVNTAYSDCAPEISKDGLTLHFWSDGPGGYGGRDLCVTTRPTTSDPWGPPVSLGTMINSSSHEHGPSISPDGLSLFFTAYVRPGGYGNCDLWVSRRATTSDPWGLPVNLGPTVNSLGCDHDPSLSADGRTLFFDSDRPGGFGDEDIWQVSIIPIVDFNGDGLVDSADMCIMVEHWGTDEPLCDIGPMPWGDGVVDVEDLIVLAEHLFEEIPPVE